MTQTVAHRITRGTGSRRTIGNAVFSCSGTCSCRCSTSTDGNGSYSCRATFVGRTSTRSFCSRGVGAGSGTHYRYSRGTRGGSVIGTGSYRTLSSTGGGWSGIDWTTHWSCRISSHEDTSGHYGCTCSCGSTFSRTWNFNTGASSSSNYYRRSIGCGSNGDSGNSCRSSGRYSCNYCYWRRRAGSCGSIGSRTGSSTWSTGGDGY